MPGFPVLHYLPEFAQTHVPIESVMPSIHFILCCSLLLLPPIFLCIRVFSNESALPIRWPKCWSFSFSISPSSEYSGLISFRIGWLDLLAVQETLKSLLQPQFKNINSSVLSLLYGPPLISVHDYWKNHTFDYSELCQQVMSLLFNMMSRFVIAFLPRSMHLLISWLQSSSAVILEPKKIKSVSVFHFSPSICHEMMGLGAMIFTFLMLSFKPAFSLSSFNFIKRLFSSSSLFAIRVVSCAYCHPAYLTYMQSTS